MCVNVLNPRSTVLKNAFLMKDMLNKIDRLENKYLTNVRYITFSKLSNN